MSEGGGEGSEMMGWRKWEGVRDRKEGRKVEREGEGAVSYVPASYMCTCQSEGSVGVDTTFRV